MENTQPAAPEFRYRRIIAFAIMALVAMAVGAGAMFLFARA